MKLEIEQTDSEAIAQWVGINPFYQGNFGEMVGN